MVLTVRESGARDSLGEVGTSSRAEPCVQGSKTTVNPFFFFKHIDYMLFFFKQKTIDFSFETMQTIAFYKAVLFIMT